MPQSPSLTDSGQLWTRAATGSDEALVDLSRAYPDLRLERDAGGALIVMNPTKPFTGTRNSQLSAALTVWANADNTGLPFDSSTGWKLPNGAVRSPDASWVRKERWSALTAEELDSFSPLCPDFAVELLSSPGDLDKDQGKMGEYMACGARLGWLIDPFKREVHVYRPQQEVEVLTDPDTITGEQVLPGFTLKMSLIWS